MTEKYNIVYPENRWVSEDTIRMKYSDAVANDEVDYTDLTDINEIIDELESTGHVTFAIKKKITGLKTLSPVKSGPLK